MLHSITFISKNESYVSFNVFSFLYLLETSTAYRMQNDAKTTNMHLCFFHIPFFTLHFSFGFFPPRNSVKDAV